MKRLLITLFVLLSALCSISALSVIAGAGLISSAGVTFETDSWDFDVDVRSVHPVFSMVGTKVFPELIDKNATEEQWKSFCSGLFNGFGASAAFKFVDNTRNRLSLGLDMAFGFINDGEGDLDFLPKYEKAWILLMKIQARYTFKINEHNGLFVSIGYPFGGWMHVNEVPNDNDAYEMDSLLIVPYTLIQLEKGRDVPGLARLVTLGLVAATVRIGYAYTF
jgi:hypothetical protein